MKLFVIRHGETEMNRKKILQGNSDSPLTDEGIQGAKELAKKLESKPFDLIISSHLGRALRTAEIIAQGRGLEVIQEPLVAEICFGDWQGKSQEEICIDEVTRNNYINYFKSPARYIPPEGAESFQDVLGRAGEFLQKMKSYSKSDPNANVLLVTHGAYIKALVSVVNNRKIEDFWKEPFITNLSITVFEIIGDAIRVESEADVYHLPGSSSLEKISGHLK
ncbi:MAG: histidine phosphatase family protein [Peptostreptococcaceae bacterium]|nr:histidine phosphatase family protein [Peptostreptococcaceae bacterium]